MSVLSPNLSRSFSSEFYVVQEGTKCLSSPSSNFIRISTNRGFLANNYKKVLFSRSGLPTAQRRSSRKRILCCMRYTSESDSSEKHRRSLEVYLKKLQNEAKQIPSNNATSDINKVDDERDQIQATEDFGSLDRYHVAGSSLREGAKLEEGLTSTSGRSNSEVMQEPALGNVRILYQAKERRGLSVPSYKIESNYRSPKSYPPFDEKESANLYLISALLSINIAVFLFEIASPVQNSEYDLYSLPMVYGAKVNDLIMVGEWWRLVTPMFLHSGLLHIGLSSWVLLTFGPQVCRVYGSFTFLLIYILGGISGNFTSFLHTSDPSVGGSGPDFAVIGAWLIYQFQNKDVTQKELSETMFEKAMLATALSFVLGSFGPIDNWTNLGAAISGILYGYFTSPELQIEDAPSNGVQEQITEEIVVSRQYASPWKSLFIFTIFVSALSSLIFLMESPLDELELTELIQIIE